MEVGRTGDLILTLAGEEAAFTDVGRRLARAALEGLDRSWAESIGRRHRHAIPHARLRKWSIWRLLASVERESPAAARQLVVVGAGWSPLGVDWLATQQDARVYEVDLSLAEPKRSLVGRIAPEMEHRWRSVTADAAHPRAMWSALQSHGWSASSETCWVAEGLLYYIPRAAAHALVRHALAGPAGSRFIIECGLPYECIDAAAGEACRAYHEDIARHIGRTSLQTSSPEDLAQAADATVLATLDPCSAERLRGDKHPHFHSPLDSTQRVALLAPASAGPRAAASPSAASA